MPIRRIRLLACLLAVHSCSAPVANRPDTRELQPHEDAPASEAAAPPTDNTSFAMFWTSSKLGYIYRASYFTASQVADPAWEAKRLSKMDMVGICEGGHLVNRRDVRWFPATPESGQPCAAIIYTARCDMPTHAKIDSLELDRQESLLGEMPTAPEKDCGAKEWASTLDRPGYEMQRYLDAQAHLVDRPVCDWRKPELHGKLTIHPETRVGLSTVIDRALAARMDQHWQLPQLVSEFGRLPEGYVHAALNRAGRIGTIFPPSHTVPDNPAHIRITQAIGLGRDGRPYCVQITARQGHQIWRRTIERSGAEGYAGIGIFGEGERPRKVDHTPEMDERDLMSALTLAMGLSPGDGKQP